MRQKILIVEDEANLAGFLSDVLRPAGYDVVLATPSQAVTLVGEVAPAAVVMDYLMPGLTGAEVAARIRGAVGESAPPIILVTGLSNVRELAQETGAAAYLRKPFDVDAFVTLVNRLVSSQPRQLEL